MGFRLNYDVNANENTERPNVWHSFTAARQGLAFSSFVPFIRLAQPRRMSRSPSRHASPVEVRFGWSHRFISVPITICMFTVRCVARNAPAVALQVAFERRILKPVFHLIGYRLWV
jgi:hypothetical protein